MNKYDFLSWCPFFLLIIVWIVSLIYYKEYQEMLYALLIGIGILLIFLWQKHFIDKSLEYEKKLLKEKYDNPNNTTN